MLFSIVPTALPPGYAEGILPLAEAKAYLRVDGSDEDDLVAALRDCAVDFVEKYLNVRLAPVADMQARFEGFGPHMRAGIGPSATVVVTAISYVDTDGESVALTPADWRVGVDGKILPAIGTSWPKSGGPVTVTFDAGYPEGACPPALRIAVRMMLVHLYDHREAIISDGLEADVPMGVVMTCSRHREVVGL